MKEKKENTMSLVIRDNKNVILLLENVTERQFTNVLNRDFFRVLVGMTLTWISQQQKHPFLLVF